LGVKKGKECKKVESVKQIRDKYYLDRMPDAYLREAVQNFKQYKALAIKKWEIAARKELKRRKYKRVHGQ
jgi:hypothetical protein